MTTHFSTPTEPLPLPIRSMMAIATFLLIGACASAPSIPQGADDSTMSAYDVRNSFVGDVDISTLTDSPLRKVVMMQIDRPVDEVFDFLLQEVDVYSDDIMAVAFDNDSSVVPGQIGLGSVRICTMTNGKRLVEPLVAFSQNRYYAYTTDPERSTMKLPIRDVVLFYTFERKAPASTLVTVRAHYTPDVFAPMRPIVNMLFKRNIDKTFAGAIDELGGRFVRVGRS